MNAKELRIGNIVEVNHYEYGDMYASVTSINDVGDLCLHLLDERFTKEEYECTMNEVNPIPITDELLLKIRFKKQENDNFINGCSSIHPINLTEWAFLANTNSYKTEIRKNILYVHELQNIYYTATNKELKYENITE